VQRDRALCGRLVALTLLTATILPVSSALAASRPQPARGSAGIGIQLVDTAAASPGPLGRSYIVDRLKPGTSIRRLVKISNTTYSTASIVVYPAAAALRHGNFAFAPGRKENELSTWTSVSESVLHLPPGGSALETVTVSVSKRASPGERYAVVWAAVSTPTPASDGIRLINRVGIRMYVSIGPGGAPPSNFAIGPLTAKRTAAGQPLVVAPVRNNGLETLDISGTLTLVDGPGGLRAGPFPMTLAAALAPGHSEMASVQLDQRLPRGPWQATIKLNSGLIHMSAKARIRFPRLDTTPLATTHPRAALLDPIVAVSLLLVLLAAAALALLISRRNANSRSLKHAA
jgi:hypothetical protein